MLGRKFTIHTDHNSLIWLTRFKYIEGQLASWLEELSQYDFQQLHRPGAKHQNADSLSQIPDSIPLCHQYKPGVKVAKLPCRGCAYCTRAHSQWERFNEDVDDMVPLSFYSLAKVQPQIKPKSNAQKNSMPEICGSHAIYDVLVAHLSPQDESKTDNQKEMFDSLDKP